MYFIFYKTNDVFSAEEKLQANNIHTEIVPTPVQDKAYCGVCIKIDSKDENFAERILDSMDYYKKV